MIVVDTGALVALIDADDDQHRALTACYEARAGGWIIPWAVLPEADYLLGRWVGANAEVAFLADLAAGRWIVDWEGARDLTRAQELCRRYRSLGLGLVDAAVMAAAERKGAEAIATLDLKHFGAVRLRGGPKIYPRDWN